MSIIQAIIGTNLTISGGGGGGGGADFTIEWWQKVENSGQNPRPWSVGLYPTQIISISYESHTSDYYWINNSYIGFVSQNHIGQGWEHMAFVRNGGIVRGYLNGTQYFNVANSDLIINTSTPLYVGTGEIAAGNYRGYITDLHIIKGTAKYISNFSPPSSPITSDIGSVFLLPAVDDSSKFTDSVGGKSASITGSPIWSADTPYIGSSNGSIYFDTSSYLDYGASVDWAMDI